LLLELDITFQYRLRKDNVVEMFTTLGKDYKDVIISQATEGIRQSCGNWSSVDFYYSRGAIQDDMENRVIQNLDAVFCDGGLLQLVNVGFDDSFLNAVKSTQAAVQDVTQAQNERQQQLVQVRRSPIISAVFTMVHCKQSGNIHMHHRSSADDL
jgi:hypothetical protein